MGAARQRGFTLLLAVILLTTAGAIFVSQLLVARAVTSSATDSLAKKFERANVALVAFASALGRLPCGADPTADTGDEVRAAGNKACLYPQGTLPWRSLGMRRDDSLDPWGWKISYRVYVGDGVNKGSLVQDNGTSTVDCDINVAPSTPEDVDASGLCQTDHKTLPASFYVDPLGGPEKGFVVNELGTNRTGIAYVLISHGSTGLGSYTSAGTALRPPSSAGEIANTSSAGIFVVAPASRKDIGPDETTHYDDTLSFVRIDDLIAKAGRGARDW